MCNLSLCFTDLGHQGDALTAIQEAVKLDQKLAADQPAALNQNLATSLNNLSLHLSDLCCQEDALAAIQEAIEFH